MADINQELSTIKIQVAKGEKPTATVREILSWINAQRRGWFIASLIDDKIAEFDLETYPKFQYAYIDQSIEFRKRTKPIQTPPSVGQPPANVTPANLATANEDPTYRIGKLKAANTSPTYVSPDAELQEAVSIMLSKDFSQLPVMTSERTVKGLVSWKSIGQRLALGLSDVKFVRDCMDQIEIVDTDASLFGTIPSITSNGCVLTKDNTGKITGIVTASDLSVQFHQLSEPFLLLGEIESHLRNFISQKLTLAELAECKDPKDTERKIERVSDMTFGEYVRLLEKPEKWSKLELKINRSVFVRDLQVINRIRNDVMHFDPDGTSPDDLQTLRTFVHFLQRIRSIVE